MPLAELVERLAGQLARQLSALVEACAGMGTVEKKRSILEAVIAQHFQLKKLLAIVAWTPWLEEGHATLATLDALKDFEDRMTRSADIMAQGVFSAQAQRVPKGPLVQAFAWLADSERAPSFALRKLLGRPEGGSSAADVEVVTRYYLKGLVGVESVKRMQVAASTATLATSDDIAISIALGVGGPLGISWSLDRIVIGNDAKLSAILTRMAAPLLPLLQASGALNIGRLFLLVRRCQCAIFAKGLIESLATILSDQQQWTLHVKGDSEVRLVCRDQHKHWGVVTPFNIQVALEPSGAISLAVRDSDGAAVHTSTCTLAACTVSMASQLHVAIDRAQNGRQARCISKELYAHMQGSTPLAVPFDVTVDNSGQGAAVLVTLLGDRVLHIVPAKLGTVIHIPQWANIQVGRGEPFLRALIAAIDQWALTVVTEALCLLARPIVSLKYNPPPPGARDRSQRSLWMSPVGLSGSVFEFSHSSGSLLPHLLEDAPAAPSITVHMVTISKTRPLSNPVGTRVIISCSAADFYLALQQDAKQSEHLHRAFEGVATEVWAVAARHAGLLVSRVDERTLHLVNAPIIFPISQVCLCAAPATDRLVFTFDASVGGAELHCTIDGVSCRDGSLVFSPLSPPSAGPGPGAEIASLLRVICLVSKEQYDFFTAPARIRRGISKLDIADGDGATRIASSETGRR